MFIKPTFIGDAILYHGDAREIMPALPVADCIVTDPPYKLTAGGPSGMMRGIFDPENYDNGGEIVDCDIEWSEIMTMIANGLHVGQAYVMANNRNVYPMLHEADKAGLYFHNLLVWDKRTATANRWYMKNCEFVGFFSKGLAQQINNCGSKQLLHVPQIDESNHPTEKPVMLMRHYIENSTQKGQLVIDPFMGSGTTLVAALKGGRRVIGIESNLKHFESACRRVEKAISDKPQYFMEA